MKRVIRRLWKKNGSIRTVIYMSITMLDLPQNLDSEMAPYFIVKTSTNDGLRDEGLVLVKALQDARAHVRSYEAMGSHQISLLLDNVAFDSMMKAWCELLFEI
jgi:acetyl esterase/lipase